LTDLVSLERSGLSTRP